MSTARILLISGSLSVMASIAAYAAPTTAQLPAAARLHLSAALGRKSAQYTVRRVHSALEADTAPQLLHSRFTSEGVEFRNDKSLWAFSLLDYGHGTLRRQVTPVVPHATLNRVDYDRGSLNEWYVNGPAGVEQGFTITHKLAEQERQPLMFRFLISGDLSAALSLDRSSVRLIDARGGTRLLYGGLFATDAAGHHLPSWFETNGHTLTISVNDETAVYPVTVDPIVQVAKLTNSQGAADSFWGYSVAVSGNTVVVGAPNATVGSNMDQGALYVFVEPAGGWGNMTQTATLAASDGATGDALGTSVSISGNTIVAGAPQAELNKDTAVGAAYVFVEPGGGWTNMTQNAKLTASDGVTNSNLGASVSTSGNTIVAGSPFQQGALYVYAEPGGGWSGTLTQNAKLTGSATGVSGLGNAVSIYNSTIAAGAQRTSVNGNFQQGAVFVFVEPAGGWINAIQTGELTASDGATFDMLGASVAISNNLIASGAPNAAVNGNLFQGAAYLFVEPAGGWTNMTQTAKLTASDGSPGDSFGFSVAIRAPGTAVVSGAPAASINSNPSEGAAYVYARPLAGWQNTSEFIAKLTPSDGVADSEAGTAIAVDTTYGVLTAPGSTVGPNVFQGAAYVFGQQ